MGGGRLLLLLFQEIQLLGKESNLVQELLYSGMSRSSGLGGSVHNSSSLCVCGRKAIYKKCPWFYLCKLKKIYVLDTQLSPQTQWV